MRTSPSSFELDVLGISWHHGLSNTYPCNLFFFVATAQQPGYFSGRAVLCQAAKWSERRTSSNEEQDIRPNRACAPVKAHVQATELPSRVHETYTLRVMNPQTELDWLEVHFLKSTVAVRCRPFFIRAAISGFLCALEASRRTPMAVGISIGLCGDTLLHN